METTTQTSIKASELRIGNWVNSKLVFHFPERVVYRPTRILAYHFQVNDEDCFHPIPLTPEILEKCGFQNYYGHGVIFRYKNVFWGLELYHGDFILTINQPQFDRFGDIEYEKWGEEKTIIHYLHQLQNLYFALTGEELDIKFYDSRSNTTSA